ncbi:extensin family protein [Phenylobacterium sp. LjRoot219]|uniref:extensin-like domain-containing protein n=1 Tax=Phenylobacterium sp. LjRoot219 TaxID=3342283 RepID=UPI003ECF2B31
MPDRCAKARRLGTALAAAAAVLGAAGCSRLADMGLDGRPLTVDTPIGPLTRWRLLRNVDEPQACRAWLEDAGVAFTPVTDRAEDSFCVVSDAGTLGDEIAGTDVRLSPRRPMMTCQLAAAMAVWRRGSVEPAARELLGADVRRMDHLGVYACRRIYNQSAGRASAHARAAAIDIAGFQLSDGRRVSVARHWPGDTPEARFLRRIRDDACQVFGTTLSPDYNAAHADHLHLESGWGGVCV